MTAETYGSDLFSMSPLRINVAISCHMAPVKGCDPK
jgi:hypothetical protein